MPYYIKLNSADVAESVTQTHDALSPAADLVEVDGLHEALLGKKYDRQASTPTSPVFVAVPAAPAQPPEWEWYIDIGPFFDRFAGAKLAVLTSADAGVQAIITDAQVRKWINLKLPEVAQSVAYIASKVPAVTAAIQTAILTTPVAPAENLALRKLYFSA